MRYHPPMHRILDSNKNPVLGEIIGELRNIEVQRDRYRFRTNLELAGTFLAYEIGATLKGRAETIRTQLGECEVPRLAEPPVLGTALRAGVPLLNGMLKVMRASDTMFFGAARVESSAPTADLEMEITLTYAALSPCGGKDFIYVDPMVATGSTIIDIAKRLDQAGIKPARFIVAALIGYSGVVERLEGAIPGIEIWFASTLR